MTANQPRVSYVFPGQGAQTVGMGKDLCEASAEARAVFEEADAVLGFSLSRLCFEGPEETLRQTENTQPAILTVSVALLRAAQAFLGPVLPAPDLVAGHSLGEYTALVAAGSLSLAEALRLVHRRGRLMQEAGEQEAGTMAAILNLDLSVVEEVCRETGAQPANLNSADQIVISGPVEAVQRAMELAQARGASRVVPLAVSGAFHSRLMEPAAAGMVNAVAQARVANARVPLVCNSTALPVVSAEEIRAELLRQVTQPVLWQRSVEYMVGQGVTLFYEIGPGRVLTGLIRRIAPEAEARTFNELSAVRG